MKYNKEKMEESGYCPECGHCGFIGCCGIRNFLEKHVRGKTDCLNEESVLREIIDSCNATYPYVKEDYLEKCPKCDSYSCSGWHKIELKSD